MSITNYAVISVARKTVKQSVTLKDVAERAKVDYDDAGIKVSSSLFEGRSHPVRQMLAKFAAVYTLHRDLTAPYRRSAGIVRVDRVRESADKLEVARTAALAARDAILPQYDSMVADDIARRGTGAHLEDYPTVDDLRAMDVRISVEALPSAHPLATALEKEQHEAIVCESVKAAEHRMVAEIVDRMYKGASALVSGQRVNVASLTGILREIANVERIVDLDADLREKLATIRTMVAVEAGTIDSIRDEPEQVRIVSERVQAHAAELAEALDF